MEIEEIPLDVIYVSELNVRKHLESEEDETGIYDLACDIRENGLINPLTVRKKDDRYEVIAGQRRFLALKMLKVENVSCNILSIDDQKAEEISLVENVQRNQMTMFDKIKSYRKLYEVYDKNIEKVISAIHISKSALKRYIKVSFLPDHILYLLDKKEKDEKITLDVADALSRLPKDIDYKIILRFIRPLSNSHKVEVIKKFIDMDCDISKLKDIVDDNVIRMNNIELAPSYPYVTDPDTGGFIKIPEVLYSDIVEMIVKYRNSDGKE